MIWLEEITLAVSPVGTLGAVVSVVVFTVRLNVTALADAPPVHCTVKLAVVAVLGVPLSTPPLLNVNPAGKLPPMIDHVYGVAPPAAVNVLL